MARDHGIDQESFERLLAWLGPNREAAAQKYEKIRQRLIFTLLGRGFDNAEYLSDVVINRVAGKVGEISHEYEGEQLKYFYGIARKVILEEHQNNKESELTFDPTAPSDKNPENDLAKEEMMKLLKKCLQALKAEELELILPYYENGNHMKNRRQLAERKGWTMNALRLHVFHIKQKVENCLNFSLKSEKEKKNEKK